MPSRSKSVATNHDAPVVRGLQRPGGRTEKVRAAVSAAVLALIKEGVTEFTISDVAARSGSSRSTIYARWPTREDLIAEALRAHNSGFRVPAMSDWREYLYAVGNAFLTFSSKPDEVAINSLSAYLGHGFLQAETWRQWSSITEEVSAPLIEAQKAGKIRPDANLRIVIASLFTTISGLIIVAKFKPTKQWLRDLVDHHIRACEPH